ncbi:hypothetical protein B0T26DRAFT_599086, partial [Lasiosphaeria miniovina]
AVEVDNFERARQREIAAYLAAASFPLDLDYSGPREKVYLNEDATLNALVQLGALRLGCDRSFLSLIDRQYQWVLSEMTRSQSLVQVRSAPEDPVWLGVSRLDACWGVCPTTMKAFMDETGAWVQTGPNVICNRSRYIVNDFRTEPGYQDRPYVTAFPWFVSYLEVPLVSSLGYLLGSYCVVDNKLNDYDSDETVGIMNEIADAIMAHLDLMRLKKNRQRSEQLVEGLSQFIKHDQSEPNYAPGDTPHHETTEQPADERVSIDPDRRGRSVDSSENPLDPEDSRPQTLQLPSSSSIQSSISPFTPSNLRSLETPPTTLQDDTDVDPMELHVVAEEVHQPDSPLLLSSDTPELHSNGFISSANIKSTFFRAAATIRAAMDMDGLMFVDAVPSAYNDAPDQLVPDQLVPDLPGEVPQDETAGPFCAAIVQSTSDHSGVKSPETPHTRLPEAVLQRFIWKFPRGHVFSADEFGPIDDGSYGIGKPFPVGSRADKDSRSYKRDVATLFGVAPGARYIIFLPLWHFQRECWYAAALGWVANPTRALDMGDISLVSAFGNTIMAQVSRLEALASSRAKSTFVSSISHELRSPLHGILASSELLRENITDPSLLWKLDMLDSCGTTLLDTLNNLLDHAIVVNDGKPGKPLANLQISDLGRLVEDVIEAVNFSHLSENAFQLSMHRHGVYSTESSGVGIDPPPRQLLVAINIETNAAWKLVLDIGAWKRIIMNLFGNALKYTCSGYIHVCLKVMQKVDSAGKAHDHIAFSVEDSGMGMTSDFLKYQVFTPFTQENAHSPGVGLGLSIVRQLVRGLGGTIDVKSSVGIGTSVEVSVPLHRDTPDPVPGAQILDEQERQSYDDHRDWLHGRTACLITPDVYATMTKADLEITNEMRSRMGTVERALRVTAGGALGMKVIVGTSDNSLPDADVYFLDDNACGEIRAKLLAPTPPLQDAPVVLLCSGARSRSCLKQQLPSNGIHLHDPIGPRKLAAALYSALKPEGLQNSGHENHRSVYQGVASTVPESRDSPLPPLNLPVRLRDGPQVPQPQAQTDERQSPGRPQVSSVSSAAPAVAAALSTREQKPRHLLLVDDNPINIKLLMTLVRKLKHTFMTACNGLEAVQMYQKSLEEGSRFDMVFMDISMPVMDGFEATRQLRQLEKKAGVTGGCKIVALTGLSSDLSRNEALASGANLFLTKPVKLDKVKQLL